MRYSFLKFILFLICTFSYSNLSFSDNDEKSNSDEINSFFRKSLKNLIPTMN